MYNCGRKRCHWIYQLSLEQINIWSTLSFLIFDVSMRLILFIKRHTNCRFKHFIFFLAAEINFSSEWMNDWPNIPITCKLNAICGTLFCMTIDDESVFRYKAAKNNRNNKTQPWQCKSQTMKTTMIMMITITNERHQAERTNEKRKIDFKMKRRGNDVDVKSGG